MISWCAEEGLISGSLDFLYTLFDCSVCELFLYYFRFLFCALRFKGFCLVEFVVRVVTTLEHQQRSGLELSVSCVRYYKTFCVSWSLGIWGSVRSWGAAARRNCWTRYSS